MEEEDAGTSLEIPALEAAFGNKEQEEALVIRREEFAELVREDDDKIVEELKDKKVGEEEPLPLNYDPVCVN